MKKQGWQGCVSELFGLGLAMVFGMVVMLVMPVGGWAQAQSSSASAAPAKEAAPASKPAAQSQASPSAEKPGPNEGIKVHGHWVIEVKNPDGSVATQREFENDLVTTSNGGTANDNGALMLAALLGRVVSSGTWAIYLGGADLQSAAGGYIVITESNPAGAALCGNGGSSTLSPYCFENLSLTAPTLTLGYVITIPTYTLGGGPTLTLSGSGLLPQGVSGDVTSVGTSMFVCAPSDTPAACTADSLNDRINFTSLPLNGVSPNPNPVPVTPGQTVSVTVAFSFM